MRGVLVFVPVLFTLWSPHALAQDAQERIRRTQRVIVSTLDEGLPDLPLDGWLRDVLGPSAQYEWTSGSCAGQRDPDDPAVPLCGIVAATKSELTVTIGIRLGEYVQGAKEDRWTTPRVDQAFVGRGRHVVMLDQLRDVPRMLTLPPQQWPARDIALEAVRCLPERPQAFDGVTCSISLINRGDAPSLARVFVDVQPHRSLGGDGVVKVQAHAARTVRLMFPWPDETGAAVTAGVEVEDRSPYHRVNERGALTLTRGEGLDVPGDLLGWVDDERAVRPILSARVTVTGAPRTIDVPVDSSISRLLIAVESVPGVTATLLRPGGARVREMDEDTSISDLRTMDLVQEIPANLRLYTIARPQPGTWQVVVAGAGQSARPTVLVQASGSTPIAFGSFNFVRKQEGVHGGYFDIDGMPLAGRATAVARLWRGPDEAAFRLVDDAGRTLRTLTLRKGQPHTADGDFLGTFELPSVPFQVVMNSVDESGAPIQRQYPVTFRAQTVAVFFNYGRSNVVEPGTKRRFSFAVTNVGAESATFALDVRTALGEIFDLSSLPVTVEPGTSATHAFTLAIPSTADRGDSGELRITATNVADPLLTNTAVARLEVARAGDADGDYVDDSKDNCRDVPNHDQSDTNRNGIGDACDPAAGGALTIRSVSPQSGPPGTIVKIGGSGFIPTGVIFVMFEGLPAVASVTSATELTVTVPTSVPVGPVLLILGTDNGFAMSPVPFIVRPATQPQ